MASVIVLSLALVASAALSGVADWHPLWVVVVLMG